MNNVLSDKHGRTVDYLRVSVTDRCNLSCCYCKTEEFKLLAREEILSLEESARIVDIASGIGVHHIRVTGGEPLIRRNIVHFTEMVRALPAIDDISITTNGTVLERFAQQLFEAGVKRINISLDTLKRDRFARITKRDRLADVLRGIDSALETGFSPVKLNVVVIEDVNDDEILDFARLTLEKPLSVRFIEHMPIDRSHSYVSQAAITARLKTMGALIPVSGVEGNGPARYVKYEDAKGTLGIIAPMSHPFCSGCNRLRLTVDGRLLPCLMSNRSYDVKGMIRDRASDEEVAELIMRAVREKPLAPVSDDGEKNIGKPMASIGG